MTDSGGGSRGRTRELEHVLRAIAQAAVDREQAFGDLDAVVGDGDLGHV